MQKLTSFYDPFLQVKVLVRFLFRGMRADNFPHASAVWMAFFHFIRWPVFGQASQFSFHPDGRGALNRDRQGSTKRNLS